MKLKDKVAIITGGSRGIGKAIAMAFIREGANVTIVSRTKMELLRTARELKKIGPLRVLAVVADISRPKDVKRAVRLTKKHFGKIDVLVNNAGIQGPIGFFVDNNIDEWIKTFDINFIGTARMVKACLFYMISQRQGKIINLSGGGAVYPRANFSAYGASKAAVVRFTETLAEELKEFHIDINSIAPGNVNTKMTKEIIKNKNQAWAKEFSSAKKQLLKGGNDSTLAASLAVFLASDESNGLSGKLISAVWDNWKALGLKIDKIMATDAFTVRRIKEEEAK